MTAPVTEPPPTPAPSPAATSPPATDTPAPPLAVSRADAANVVGIGVSTLDDLCKRRKCPAPVRIGGRVLYVVADLSLWLELGCPPRREFEARKTALAGRVARRR